MRIPNELCQQYQLQWENMLHTSSYIDGILPKGPYPPCLRMADRALLAGYHRYLLTSISIDLRKYRQISCKTTIESFICAKHVLYSSSQRTRPVPRRAPLLAVRSVPSRPMTPILPIRQTDKSRTLLAARRLRSFSSPRPLATSSWRQRSTTRPTRSTCLKWRRQMAVIQPRLLLPSRSRMKTTTHPCFSRIHTGIIYLAFGHTDASMQMITSMTLSGINSLWTA